MKKSISIIIRAMVFSPRIALCHSLFRVSSKFLRLAIPVKPSRDESFCRVRLATLSTLLPRQVPVDGAGVVQGEVSEGLHTPTVHITDGSGRAQPVKTDAAARQFKARFQCWGRGVHRVEVMAEGPAGPVVAANVPVWCGESPPAQLALTDGPGGERDPARAAQRLFELANAERAKLKLPALRWDARLAKVALAHSGDMAGHGFIAHNKLTLAVANRQIE